MARFYYCLCHVYTLSPFVIDPANSNVMTCVAPFKLENLVDPEENSFSNFLEAFLPSLCSRASSLDANVVLGHDH